MNKFDSCTLRSRLTSVLCLNVGENVKLSVLHGHMLSDHEQCKLGEEFLFWYSSKAITTMSIEFDK